MCACGLGPSLLSTFVGSATAPRKREEKNQHASLINIYTIDNGLRDKFYQVRRRARTHKSIVCVFSAFVLVVWGCDVCMRLSRTAHTISPALIRCTTK